MDVAASNGWDPEAIGTVAAACATSIIAILTTVGLWLLGKGVREQAKVLKVTAMQNVNQEMLRLDRWLVEHPDYRKALAAAKIEDPDLTAALGETFGDFISLTLDNASYLPKAYVKYWWEYFLCLLNAWPQLMKHLQDNNDWYGEEVERLVQEALSRQSVVKTNAPGAAVASGTKPNQPPSG